MRWLALAAFLCITPSIADAGARCPPGTYVARYSFGIWVCKQPTPLRLACPPGHHLADDFWGTPKCVRNRIYVIRER